LDARFDDLLNQDYAVYRQHYPASSKAIFPSIQALSGGIKHGYDVVHLLCDVTDGGTIVDCNGEKMTGADLIQTCCDQDVKLLWIASDNPPERYIEGFGARDINLVMTLKRNGPDFPHFLQRLLSQMACGVPMPFAWVHICPQMSSDHPSVPETIFSAGRSAVRLFA
jgi:hypothetical protein